MSALQTSQSQALGEFFHAYRLNPHEPLTLLCIALAYIQLAMTRKVDDRNRTILQAFAFLQVRETVFLLFILAFCCLCILLQSKAAVAVHGCIRQSRPTFLILDGQMLSGTYVMQIYNERLAS